jgi:AcrR family transcriptional regulator
MINSVNSVNSVNPGNSPTRVRTKQRLMDAMVKVVGTSGMQNASVRAIAREAGCNEAVLYHHFDNKNAMQEEVFANLVLDLARTRREQAAKETDPIKFIRSWVEASYRFYDDRPNAFAFVLLAFPPITPIDHTAFTANSELFKSSLENITPPAGHVMNITVASLSAFSTLILGPPRDIHLGIIPGPAANYADEIATLGTALLVHRR